MKRFWELFQQSLIVQAMITLIAIGVACYLMATGQEVPELLGYIVTTVLGFYFGTKVQNSIQRAK